MTAVVNGEPLASVATNPSDTQIVLPGKLSSIKKAESFASLKLKRNSSEEVLSVLISFDKHESWFSETIPERPPNGSMLLFNRQNVKDYRKDGYTWKKRTSSRSTREDHCKLKVAGFNCLNVVYTHSAIVPTFHRRIYWLLQNPDIVLVHYLNLIDDLQEEHINICEKRKENILCEINSIFSGVEPNQIPKFEVIEAEQELQGCEAISNASKKAQKHKKLFKVTITPVINDLPTSIAKTLQQHVKSYQEINLWTRSTDVSNRINVVDSQSQSLPSNSFHVNTVPSNGHHSNIPHSNSHQGTPAPCILQGNMTSARTFHSNNLPRSSLQSECLQSQPMRNLPSSNMAIQSLTDRTIQSTALFSPMCNMRLSNPTLNLPVKSSGLITQGVDLPTSIVRFPSNVTSTLHIQPLPLQYIQPGPVTQPHQASTSLTSAQNVPTSIISHPQPTCVSSVGVGTQSLVFFSSEAGARAAPILNVRSHSDSTAAMTESLANASTASSNSLDLQCRAVESSQGCITLGQQETPVSSIETAPENVPQGLNEPSQSCSIGENAVETLYSGRSTAADKITLTSAALWHDNRPTNQVTEQLSSSPSSDYGSLLSESGTRFSGSESMSSEMGSNGFDGPFRLPLPVTQNNRVTQFQTNNILSSSHVTSIPSSESSGIHRDTSTPLDSNNVDMTFDFSDLQPFEDLDYSGLDIDLNSVLGEYFNNPEAVPVTSSKENASNLSSNGKDEQKQMEIESSDDNDTRAESPLSNSLNHRDDTPTSSSIVVPNNSNPSNSCHAPEKGVVLPNNYQCSQTLSYHDDQENVDNRDETCRKDNQSSESEVNLSDINTTSELNVTPEENTAPEVNATHEVNNNCTLLPSVVPGSACITDFSPEWSYPEGGVKVLVTGEWSSPDMSYTCLFDGCSVEAVLVQVGVLRCYCPPHEPGLVTLQVACNGFIVSNACVFEYRAHDSPGDLNTHHEWLAMDDARFKLALLDRLERLESRLSVQTSTDASRTHSDTQYQQCLTFEERIILTCRGLFDATTVSGASRLKRPYRGMTLMHLAAALGFSKLLHEMTLKCRDPRTSELIRQELDPSRKDEFSCTPLMWACALGQRDAVAELLCCHANSLLVPDACGRLPLQLARDRGYFEIVDCIEDFATSSSDRRSLFNLGSSEEDDEETSENVTSSHQSVSSLPPHSQPMSVETSYTDRACSPMHVEEVNNGNLLLNQALVQIHEMISEAEREADLETGRLPIQLSPVQEENEILSSPGGLASSGARFRSLSSASSQSSPLTPSSKSSLSPGSPAFLNSPHSSPGLPPDTKEFHEFLCSSKKLLEKNFSELTLTDREQQELYQAALIIQEAYRSYKIRRQQHDQEIQAAVLIQNHYRRYKQFLSYKKRTHAALIIQNQYRAYREHEQFKKSRRAAAIIQNQFRIYRLRRQSKKRRDERKSKQQEARFIRQSSNRSNTSV